MNKPTVIIIHGAFCQPAHYAIFTRALKETGLLKVEVPQLPSASQKPPEDAFNQDVSIIRKAVEDNLSDKNDVLLLVHSYGGIPTSEALIGVQDIHGERGKILGIIFVAAMVPNAGENLAVAMKTGVAPWVKIDGDLCTADNPAHTLFNTLQDKDQVDSAVAKVTPHATSAFITPASQAAWSDYPCTYVKCLKDNSTSLQDQDHMIAKLNDAKTTSGKEVGLVELESDHCPFICMPEILTQVVMDVLNRSTD